MISYAFVDGFTRVARDEAIERLKRAIARANGVIVDFAFFGREAIRLTVEVDAGELAILRRELETAEIELLERSATELDAAARTMSTTHPVLAMLHLSFMPAESESFVTRAAAQHA